MLRSSYRKRRIIGIDAIRPLGLIGVIAIHEISESGLRQTWSAVDYITGFSRFAVPLFFLVGGYFQRNFQQLDGGIVTIPLRRLIPPYLFWFVVYYVLFQLPTGKFSTSMADLSTGGNGYHLWFLPAMGFALVVCAASRALLPSWFLLPLAIGTYALALAFGAYRSALSIPGPYSRSGLLAAVAFVSWGKFLSTCRRPGSSPVVGLATLLVGVVITVIEIRTLPLPSITGPFDFMLGTPLLSTGVFLIAISCHSDDSRVSALASVGQLSLGVYCLHLLILRVVLTIAPEHSVVGLLGAGLATILLSFAIAATMDLVAFMRPLVR